jgi:hypothetical protein
LDISYILKKDASHRDVVWFLVIVLMVGAVASILPFFMALLRARGLNILNFTSPQAAQIAWLG